MESIQHISRDKKYWGKKNQNNKNKKKNKRAKLMKKMKL